jgi:uncharacterized repeat protein (TIGR03806 family)
VRRILIGLLLFAACDGDDPVSPSENIPPALPPGSSDYGIPVRPAAAALAFPDARPAPGSMRAVRAFPALDFTNAVDLTNAGDGTDRLFIVEQNGYIQVFQNDNDASTYTTFLDISAKVERDGGEQGLLGLTFHPDYANTGYFYIYYSVLNQDKTRLSRYRVSDSDPNRADAASETILIEIGQDFRNHNGGGIDFGPDGCIYVCVGDGGSGGDPNNRAQDKNALLGSILRLHDDGSIPSDNPFVGVEGRDEIYAWGMRHPWRITFDRETGDCWCGDVGQGAREEIDLIVNGGNYGWDIFEGDINHDNPSGLPATSFVAPVIEYSHSLGNAVIGGYVYRGARVPSLFGAYLYGDNGSGRVWALVWDGDRVVSNVQIASVSNLTTFGEDEAGEVFAVSHNGRLYRFEPQVGTPPAIPLLLSDTGLFDDTAQLEAADGLIEYDLNSPLWSDGSSKRRWMALPDPGRIVFNATGNWDFPQGTVLVKHFEMALADGTTRRLETRALVRHNEGWQGYTYRWNAAQTDADLLGTAHTDTLAVPDGQGGQRQLDWTYSSRADCMRCHTESMGFVLGPRTGQLNRDFAYEFRTDNQLRAWNYANLFTTDIGAHTAHEAMPNPADEGAPLAARARAYLEANCAFCHTPGGGIPVNMDLRFGASIPEMSTHNVTAMNPAGIRITPDDRDASVLWYRLASVGELRMPPLGSVIVDPVGADVVGRWIDAGAE